MESETPKFNELIGKVLEELTPSKVICKWSGENPYCEGEFEILEEDIKFLKMLKVPAPSFCPTCRRMRRLLHMNFIRLFKRKCEAPTHSEMMISIYPEECPFPVYDYQYFIGDVFDPFIFGEKYKEGTSGMEILLAQRKVFPMPSFLNRDPSSVNSDYSNGGRNVKNGYYVFACYTVEDAWYSDLVSRSRNVMDSHSVWDSELIYTCVQVEHLYKCSFIYFSNNCTDSMFLFDCKNCDNCFGCVNLRGGKYVVYNKQYTKEEYEKFMQDVYPLSRTKLSEYKNKFWQLVKSMPINGSRNLTVTNILGANIRNSKNIYDANNVVNSENARHCDTLLSHHDSMDAMFSGGHSSFLYMTLNIGSQSSNVKFSVSSKFSIDCEFIFNSKNLNNCFMCFGLQNKSYCVLNVQYSKEEYFKIVDEIKSEMLRRGEYGDGLGFEFSAQAYNFSGVQISYPLEKNIVEKLGGYWAEEPETNAGDTKVIKAQEVPETIEEVSDDAINTAIECEVTGRPFRITASELEFYRRRKLPLPTVQPSVRMENNTRLIPYGIKYKTVCAKCKNDMYSLFDPEENYILYCETCYQEEVY